MGETTACDDLLLKNFFAEVREVERDNEVVRILSCFKLNPYEHLNLPFDSSVDDVKRQYRKLQGEVIVSDSERLRMTQSNMKMADTLPRIERLRRKEQGLQRRLLRVMRIVEALEEKGCRLPLTKGEIELAEKLAGIIRQLKGYGAELSRRVQNLLSISRMQGNGGGESLILLD